MLNKVLIANRGEIAARLIRACKALAIKSVAIYSDPDADAAWLREADERYPLPGETAADTYLNIPAVLDIAKAAGADGIHPGYGFLSENPAFARACDKAGVTFIGPSAAAMEVMGSKASAREVAIGAGVPVIPGVDGAGKSAAALREAAASIGLPLLVKASAGGGGKGMRIVESMAAFDDAVQAARSEALSSFGDDHLLLEKFITNGRHIEVQILGDRHGNVRHLYERDCSVQRRHQKIIEETPAPGLPVEVREAMTSAAVALATAVGYESAGTVEFILGEDNAFYLLEMNTRLQVEHPVTELLTGVDLAQWQLRIAAGESLAELPDPLPRRGHALECRLYAEDPALNFLPSIGKIGYYRAPGGPHIRVDDGIASGSQVTPYYDPMLAKVITWGDDREDARQKMHAALQETVVLGVTTNIPYLLDILDEPDFISGGIATNYLDDHFAGWRPEGPENLAALLGLAAAELFAAVPAGAAPMTGPAAKDPWDWVGRWRNV